MRFNPKNEEQVQDERFGAFEPGEYAFEVTKAEEKVSKAGNDMIEIMLKLYSDDGKRTAVAFDYLMPEGPMAYKLRHFAYAAGIQDRYNSGELADYDCLNTEGRVRVLLGKDSKGRDRNEVEDYVLPDIGEEAPPPAKQKDEGIHLSSASAERAKHQPVKEEDIPF